VFGFCPDGQIASFAGAARLQTFSRQWWGRRSPKKRGIIGLVEVLWKKVTVAAFVSNLVLLTSTVAVAQQPVTIFAAASLKNALDASSAVWSKKSGVRTAISYAGSAALAKQIEAGAPADIFISADRDWMDYLAERDLVDPATRFDLLGNRLALIGQVGAISMEITPDIDLAGLLGDSRLAMAAPDSVPAGKYGKAALERLGLWASVKGKVAGAENVRAALQYVSRGEASLGVVYETDARADRGVSIIGTFPQDSHPPIVYPVALLKTSSNAAANDYLSFLRSQDARFYFEAEGFQVLSQDD